MKKIKNSTFVMLTLLFLISCKEDKDPSQAFFAKGYWKGNFFISPVFENINRPNGISHLHLPPGNPAKAMKVLANDSIYGPGEDIFKHEYVDIDYSVPVETQAFASNYIGGAILFIERTNPFGKCLFFPSY